jgi:hypothetical protein
MWRAKSAEKLSLITDEMPLLCKIYKCHSAFSADFAVKLLTAESAKNAAEIAEKLTLVTETLLLCKIYKCFSASSADFLSELCGQKLLTGGFAEKAARSHRKNYLRTA